MRLKKIDKILLVVLFIILVYGTATVYADLTGTEGLAIDLSSAGAGTDFTIAFDPTELLGNRTWGDASTDTIVWTWNRATGTDPTITFNDGSIALQALTLTTDLADGDVADNITLTNITQITTKPITALSATNWRLFYSGAGSIPIELALGANGTFLESNGAAAAPAFRVLADGDVPNNITIDLATLATTLTITDNESTAENNPIVFVAGGDLDGGNLGLESDGTCYYTPSTGKITTTGFVGALTGNADTVTTNANLTGDVTSVGNATDITESVLIDGGSDPIDGDKLEITATWDNITPDTSIAEADSVDDLAAILEGIDDALGTSGGDITAVGNVTTGAAFTADGTGNDLYFETTADANETKLTATDPTADRTVTMRDASGTILLSGDTLTGDVTATFDIDGSTVTALANDTVAVAEFLGSQDWGDMSTAAGGTVSLDPNTVGASELAAADYGDVTISNVGAITIDDNAVVEADLKVVDSPSDEDIFTYEATTGDFEWHTAAEMGIGTATAITDDLIVEADLNATNAPGAGEDNYVLTYNHAGTNFTWAADATGGAPATADISDVSVTQTELAELETIGATTISANQWATLGGIAETLTNTELNLLDGITVLSGSNTGDNTVATSGDSATAFFDAGTIEHERGGIEADISAIADGGMLVGTGAGTMAIRASVLTGGAAGFIKHELGGLEADINAYTGLVAITGGATAEVDSKSELEGHIADVADFAEADGDVYTGNADFGGGDLELPQASPAVPDADGEIEIDFTDGTVVVQHGSAHAELGAATDVVIGKLIKSWSATIFEPDGVNDVITVKAINSIEYPHGVVITAVYLGIASNTTYTLTVQNFDDFDTINAANGTIDAVTYTADTTGEIIDTSPTYATIAAGQIIMVSIPATDVDWVHFEIYYYEPAA